MCRLRHKTDAIINEAKSKPCGENLLNLVLSHLQLVVPVKIELVRLEVSNLPVDLAERPGCGADTGGFEGQAELDGEEDDGVREEGKRVAGRDDAPDETADHGGDDGTEEAGVDEVLEPWGGLEGGVSGKDLGVLLGG